MTHSRLFATWKPRVEAGHLFPPKCPQVLSLSKQRSQHQQQKLQTLMQQVTSTRTWGTGKRSCSGSVTSVPSGLFTTERRALQITTKDFDKFLMGRTYNKNKNVHGFYKYSPADNNNRNPSSGFATISKLHFYSKYGISEVHDGTDKWINMWHSAQSSNNFVTSDDRLARGTKCIAGYCYLNKPIWVMVR